MVAFIQSISLGLFLKQTFKLVNFIKIDLLFAGLKVTKCILHHDIEQNILNYANLNHIF